MLARIGSSDKAAARFRQRLAGVPVDGATVNVLLDARGALLAVQSTALPGVRSIDVEPEIAASLAIKAEVLAALGRGSDAVSIAAESLELSRKMGMRGREVVALDAMVEAQLAAGDPRAAIEFQTQARTYCH